MRLSCPIISPWLTPSLEIMVVKSKNKRIEFGCSLSSNELDRPSDDLCPEANVDGVRLSILKILSYSVRIDSRRVFPPDGGPIMNNQSGLVGNCDRTINATNS